MAELGLFSVRGCRTLLRNKKPPGRKETLSVRPHCPFSSFQSWFISVDSIAICALLHCVNEDLRETTRINTVSNSLWNGTRVGFSIPFQFQNPRIIDNHVNPQHCLLFAPIALSLSSTPLCHWISEEGVNHPPEEKKKRGKVPRFYHILKGVAASFTMSPPGSSIILRLNTSNQNKVRLWTISWFVVPRIQVSLFQIQHRSWCDACGLSRRI